jgi:putative ABC transport system permease protein
MKLLIKDQIQKIKHSPFNFISLSILILIISFTYTTVESSIRRLDENHEEYLETQQIEDFYFVMGEIDVNYLSGSAIFTICRELGITVETQCAIAYVEDSPESMNKLNFIINEGIKEHPEIYENLISTYIDDFKEENDYIVEKNIVVNIEEDDYYYKFLTLTKKINVPYITEGILPENDFEIAVFPEFAKANSINIGDTYSINSKEYLVTGFFYKPEFLFPIMSMDQIEFDEETQTLVLCNENTIRDLNQFLFTKYLVKGDLTTLSDQFGYEEVQSGDYSFLGKNMQLVYMLMPADIDFRIITLGLEVENARAFINIFLPVFTLFVTVLLLIFMKRYVKNNEDDIFTLHALGYSRREIALSILLYPFLISLHAIAGYLLGLFVSFKTFSLYSNRYLFPKAEFTIYQDIFIYAVIIPIIVILVLNYISIYSSIARKPKVKKVRLRIFKFTPLKTVLQTFALFLTISIMITFGLNGNSMFTAFIDYTKEGNNFENMINLQRLTNDPVDENYQTYTYTPTKIIKVNSRPLKSSQASTLYGIKSNNSLKLLINNDIDNNNKLGDGTIISEYLQTKLNLKVGDSLTFTVGSVESTEEIVGVSNELLENNLFILQSKLNDFYQLDDTYYNGVYTIDDLYESEFIVTKISYRNSLEEFSSILNISSLIINFLVILSIIISIFIFTLIIMNYYSDNRISIAILKSIGYNRFEINKKYLLILYVLLVISYVVAVPITVVLLQEMLNLLMDSIGFKLILDISFLNILSGFIIIHALFISIVYNTNRYYDSIQISEIIRHNTK